MDNCPTHHHGLVSEILRDFLDQLNIEVVFMPAYSPDFNPTEYVFGKIRTLMKYQFWHITNTNIKDSLYSCVEHITPADMAGFFNITGYLTGLVI